MLQRSDLNPHASSTDLMQRRTQSGMPSHSVHNRQGEDRARVTHPTPVPKVSSGSQRNAVIPVSASPDTK